MTDLKEFEKFLKICRKQGVTDATFNGTTVKLGPLPIKADGTEQTEDIPTDELTQEQLMDYHIQNAIQNATGGNQ